MGVGEVPECLSVYLLYLYLNLFLKEVLNFLEFHDHRLFLEDLDVFSTGTSPGTPPRTSSPGPPISALGQRDVGPHVTRGPFRPAEETLPSVEVPDTRVGRRLGTVEVGGQAVGMARRDGDGP